MKILIATIAAFLIISGPTKADVIVQTKQCYRVWNSRDTITSTMSDASWIQWKKRHKQHIHREDVRYVVVDDYERYSTVKDYRWIDYEVCR